MCQNEVKLASEAYSKDKYPWCFKVDEMWYFANDEAKEEMEGLGVNVIPR